MSEDNSNLDESILIPFWAGDTDYDEIEYIVASLRKSRSPRIRWGFNPTAKRFNREYVRLVALLGVVEGKKKFLDSLKKQGKKPWHNLSR